MFVANVRAPVFLFCAVWDHLPPRGGRILNISSLAGKRDCVDPMITYGATKAALESYTRSMGRQFARQKLVTINSVSVGPTNTDTMEDAMGRLPAAYVETMKEYATAEKRFAEPYDIAAIVSFLASDDARWINGSCIPANGGAINMVQG
jgi:3-oxoacyl-[acyl-carrier protein] reductase